MNRFILTFKIIIFSTFILAQTDNISGIVNSYTPVTAIDPCPSFITAADVSEFSIGDKVLIIQMKGAQIDSVSNSPNFGDILNFREAGNYEMSRIQNIIGNTVHLVAPLTRTYDVNYFVQLIKVSEHINASVTADLTCPAWNGLTGGVLVIDCQNKLTLNANITANSKGFRPGVISSNLFDCTPSNDYFYPSTSFYGGRKGEGITEVSNLILNGRGKLANGGGGGNQVNTGGGGGGNFGAGGKAGFGHPVCGVHDLGGLGGGAIPYGTGLDKLFLGGGGGGGQQNDGQASPGSLGGGIILLIANEIEGNNNSIESYGIDAGAAASDGAGGGGAGGTIAISCNTYTTNLTLDVHGGKGGDCISNHGPAGGGGGGLVYVSSVLPGNVTTILNGGNPGVWSGTTNSNGCIQGDIGGVITPFIITDPVSNAQRKSIQIENTCFDDQTNIYLNDISFLTSLNWIIVEASNPSNIIISNSDWDGNTVQFPTGGEYLVIADLQYSCYRDTLFDTLTIIQVNNVNLGNDTINCIAENEITLDAGGGYDYYFWQGIDTTQTYTADTSGQYIVEVAKIGHNLVLNGDFEAGNTDFISEYSYVNCGTLPILGNSVNVDTYTVGDASTCFGIAGTGNVLHFYDVQTANYGKVFWGQVINVTPNTDYIIRLDSYEDLAGAQYQPELTRFEIFANNTLVQADAIGGSGVWHTNEYFWNSGGSNSLSLEIRNGLNNFNLGQAGLDPFFDNIFLAQLCKKSDTINVLVGEAPTAQFSLIDTCEYDAVVYTDESIITLPETISSWSWDVDNDGSEDYNTQNPTHTFTAGSYTTKLTVTSALGCTKDTTMPVVVYPKPTANFTFESKCLYDSLLFVDASNVLGDVITAHAWNFGETTFPAVQSILPSPYHTFSNAGTYSVSEIVSTANGCFDTINQDLEVFEIPTANYATSNVCQDLAAEFTDQSVIASGTIDNWAWDFGDVSTGTNQNETHNYALDGTYTVQLVVSSNNSCTDTLEQDIIIYPMPVADFTMNNECLEETIPFTDNSSINPPGVIEQWAWDFGDMSNPSSDQSPLHLYQDPGTFNVTLVITSDQNCSNSLQQSVTVHPLPQVSFVASEVCMNEPPTVFTNTSVISSGSNVGYAWSFGDLNSSTSLQESPTFNYGLAGNYEVTLGLLSDQGCTSVLIDTIKVKHKPVALFTQDTTGGCAPICINFISESEDSIGIASWDWLFENNLGEGSNKYEGYCYESAGTYDVKLIVQNTEGCYDTIESLGLINTFEYPTAEFELTPEETTIEEPTITFTNLSTDAVTWAWDFADEELDSTTYDPIHIYADTGSYIVELIAYSANGCSTKAYHEVIVLPIENVFVPTAFSPNGDGENDVLYVRGYLKGLYFSVYDRWGKKVFETTNPKIGWEGLINGKPAMEGVYMWYLQTSFNGEAKKFKGDVSLMR